MKSLQKPILSVFITICILFIYDYADARQGAPYQITTDQDSRGGIQLYATTETPVPLILTIDFTTLRNLDASVALPYSTNLTGTRTRLLTLTRQWEDQQINYRYRTRYHAGCLDTNPSEIEYLLPFPEGSEATAGTLSYLGTMINQNTPDGWYSLSFNLEEETAITAMRRGTVIAVNDGVNRSENANLVYRSDRNYVTVLHADCTFARYRTFKDSQILVQEGDLLLPGDPIGLTDEDNQIRILVYYRNDESVTMDPRDSEGVQNWNYVKPKFRTAENSWVEMVIGSSYLSIHPDEIITSEMGRRERRRWSRDQ